MKKVFTRLLDCVMFMEPEYWRAKYLIEALIVTVADANPDEYPNP